MEIEATTMPALRKQRPTSLSADFGWMFVGNAAYAAGQFVILMLLAKLLPPQQVGRYALGLALVYPVMMFANLQLRAVLTSDVRQQTPFGCYLSLRLLTTSVAFVIIFVVTQILRYSRELSIVVLMVGVAYGVETISDVYYARLQLHDRLEQVSKSMMAKAVLSVVCLGFVTYLTRNVLWGMAAVAVARSIILIGYDICPRTHGLAITSRWFPPNDELSLRFDPVVQGKLLWVSLPLGIVVLLGCLNSSVPSFFIKNSLGDKDVGIFTAIGFVVSVGNMAVVSLGQSAFTRLARSFAAGDLAMFRSLLAKLLLFGAFVGVCGMLLSRFAGREILTVLFRAEYAERADLLPWIMAAGGVLFMAQFLGFGLTAAGLYHSQVALNIVANASLFAGCYWLVAREGLLGAILAMLIAAAVQLIGSIVVLTVGVRDQLQLCAERVATP